MAKKVNGNIEAGVEIGDGWQIVWDAVDPNTGASVAGVKISNANVVGADLSAGISEELGDFGPFMLVPGPGA